MVVPGRGCLPYARPMDDVDLPTDLREFAVAIVASGRYRDMGEVVAAGVSLLRQAESRRDMLLASVEAAGAAGERDGFLTLDEVMDDADVTIAEMVEPRL